MSIIDAYDASREAVISPGDAIKPIEGFPETALCVFSARTYALAARLPGAREIARLKSANMDNPIYASAIDGREIAICLSPIGSAAAAGALEEIIAMGGRRFLYMGSCGALSANFGAGHLIVPSAAYRDEGASYHYLPAADFVELTGAQKLSALLFGMDAPYSVTKTWTTDAIYRETRANVNKRLAAGCEVVEMECAALAAVAKFRGVEFMELLYGADSLAGDKWDRRTLGATPEDRRRYYLELALNVAARI